MNNFSSYEKMPTNLQKLGLSEQDFTALEKCRWVVTEKIHGANFSFIYQNNTLKFAKRKSLLSWSDDFFGFQLLVNQIEDNMMRLFEQLSLDVQGEQFIVYGELFGGHYPHATITQNPHLQAIQTGIHYSPDIHFCAFDIAVTVQGEKSYLDYQTAINYFETFGILYAQPLFIGKLGDALGFDTRVTTSIPQQLQLPKIENNVIEGVVIKPFNMKDNGFKQRPIIKLKNKEFEEQQKFHQAQKWGYIPNLLSQSEELSFILDELREYINVNRLESAVSKIGSLDYANEQRMQQIQEEFLQDVFTDFNENNDDLLCELTHDDKQWITARAIAGIKKVIYKNNI